MGRLAVLIARWTDMDPIKVSIKLYQVLYLVQGSGIAAILIFAILWMLATCSGCATGHEAPALLIEKRFDLSEEISRITLKMRQAGCFPKDVHVSYTNPTSYTVQISGPYYEKFDTNKLKGKRK